MNTRLLFLEKLNGKNCVVTIRLGRNYYGRNCIDYIDAAFFIKLTPDKSKCKYQGLGSDSEYLDGGYIREIINRGFAFSWSLELQKGEVRDDGEIQTITVGDFVIYEKDKPDILDESIKKITLFDLI